jgi:hypothetical protein
MKKIVLVGASLFLCMSSRDRTKKNRPCKIVEKPKPVLKLVENSTESTDYREK